ncbi:hypothetical protein [Sphingomonas bacterium]|uniref:hypothetical protein n=1 Tax=Sphingomonas bacterium TaxID=1895847 RepID=UPI00157567A5|nr:hypothetical protein [Sphingomonas bacterium]
MANLVALSQTHSRGSYVVAGPVRTGAIGDILRASFTPGRLVEDDIDRLLAQLDRLSELA